ncbi:hypothetical protein [Paenibacillus sacheonensis]|uniref:Uncharacterized protein n=1 Tax=Paenibacillus sacheonensis TaxID=742054 RepID=A0A7X4YLG9_9BACL|nr:hypothetical protein [Paenibacillus sacheonensis]MBM7568345.1 hypothetical protein [Paenibacillus sacheonensis]NBC68472.1 hypothetical protein [Paenibacillus sacheonensis]
MKRHVLGIALTILGVSACISTVSAVDNEYTPVKQTPDTITAFIHGIDVQNGKETLQADPIEWFEGKAADEEFLKREADSGLDGAPDGYYIVNDDEKLETLEVDPQAAVVMQIYDRTGSLVDATTEWNQSISLAKFNAIYRNKAVLDVSAYPYHLTIKDGKVVRIVQQFVP